MQCWYRSRLFIVPVLAFLTVMAGLLVLAVSAQGTPAARAFSAVRQAPAAPAVQAGSYGRAQHHAAAVAQQPRAVRTVTRIPAPYTVRAADTLWKIAAARCHSGRDWSGIYLASKRVIGKNPDVIVPGQLLTVSCTHPYVSLPRPPVPQPYSYSQPSAASIPVHHSAPAYHAPAYHSSGIYSYSALEALWESAGGSAGTAAHAACIAEHESGGNPGAISPTDDWGLWQIHAGGYPMLNPYANAVRAVAMSSNGTNWSAWTTAGFC